MMDIQPLIVMITGKGQLHGFTHSFIGASLIAVFSGLTGKYLSEVGLKILDISRNNSVEIIWGVAFLSAFIGSYSHVILDGIMHSDVEPFYPFTTLNIFQGIISLEALHKLCLNSGLFGAMVYYTVRLRVKRKK
ncbi:MAG: metal-dependent hydrolase [Emcibacter sp.]|nr:metal-dependent hydrolase [Emcibacter sp.]